MLIKQIAFLSVLCSLFAGSISAQAAMPMPKSNLFSLKEVASAQMIAAGEEHIAPGEKSADHKCSANGEHKCASDKKGDHKCATDKKGEHKCASKKCASDKKGEHKCAAGKKAE